MNAIVILNRGHGQKTPDRFDPGATHGELREVDLVALYFESMKRVLEAGGVKVRILDSGPYRKRNARARFIAAKNSDMRIVHCYGHVNSNDPPGQYGCYFHHPRSRLGKLAAETIAAEFEGWPEFDRVRVFSADYNSWRNPYNILRESYTAPPNLCGVLLEPYFIQHPEHTEFTSPDGAERIGSAIAAGLIRFLDRP